jgi:hypothetical protein
MNWSIALIVICCGFGQSSKSKRFVSEIDVTEEIAKINEKLGDLTKSLAAKNLEIEALQKSLKNSQGKL